MVKWVKDVDMGWPPTNLLVMPSAHRLHWLLPLRRQEDAHLYVFSKLGLDIAERSPRKLR